jgi:hypothetical protein
MMAAASYEWLVVSRDATHRTAILPFLRSLATGSNSGHPSPGLAQYLRQESLGSRLGNQRKVGIVPVCRIGDHLPGVTKDNLGSPGPGIAAGFCQAHAVNTVADQLAYLAQALLGHQPNKGLDATVRPDTHPTQQFFKHDDFPTIRVAWGHVPQGDAGG